MSFYCGIFTKPECAEKCCFICPKLPTCKFECGLSGVDDKCVYQEEETSFYAEDEENAIV